MVNALSHVGIPLTLHGVTKHLESLMYSLSAGPQGFLVAADHLKGKG